MMQTQIKESIDFLRWLKVRLYIKHNDQDAKISTNIEKIICLLSPSTINVDKKKIMKICKKMYPGFAFDKDEESAFDVGYTKKEKIEILNYVTNIISEYQKND